MQQLPPPPPAPPPLPPVSGPEGTPANGPQFGSAYGGEVRRAPRRRWPFALAAVVLAGLAAGVALVFLNRTAPPPAAVSKPKPQTVLYRNPQGQFSARFAGTPTEHDTTEQTSAGPRPYNYWEYTAPGVDEFAGVISLPVNGTFDLQAGLQGIAQKAGGTVTLDNRGTYQGYPALEGRIALQGNSTYMGIREIKVGQFVFVIVAVGNTDPPADFAQFADSVRILIKP